MTRVRFLRSGSSVSRSYRPELSTGGAVGGASAEPGSGSAPSSPSARSLSLLRVAISLMARPAAPDRRPEAGAHALGRPAGHALQRDLGDDDQRRQQQRDGDDDRTGVADEPSQRRTEDAAEPAAVVLHRVVAAGEVVGPRGHVEEGQEADGGKDASEDDAVAVGDLAVVDEQHPDDDQHGRQQVAAHPDQPGEDRIEPLAHHPGRPDVDAEPDHDGDGDQPQADEIGFSPTDGAPRRRGLDGLGPAGPLAAPRSAPALRHAPTLPSARMFERTRASFPRRVRCRGAPRTRRQMGSDRRHGRELTCWGEEHVQETTLGRPGAQRPSKPLGQLHEGGAHHGGAGEALLGLPHEPLTESPDRCRRA